MMFLKLPKNYMKEAITVERDSRSKTAPSFSFLLWNGKALPRGIVERFLKKVYTQHYGTFIKTIDLFGKKHVLDQGACWFWKKGKDGSKYGSFWLDRKSWKSHIVANLLFRGPLRDDNKHLHHTCVVRYCINPSHLTPLDKGEHGAEHRKIRVENPSIHKRRRRSPGVIPVEKVKPTTPERFEELQAAWNAEEDYGGV
jgi:hypothetical protein